VHATSLAAEPSVTGQTALCAHIAIVQKIKATIVTTLILTPCFVFLGKRFIGGGRCGGDAISFASVMACVVPCSEDRELKLEK